MPLFICKVLLRKGFVLSLQLIGQLTGPSRSEAGTPFVVKVARRMVQVLLVNRFVKFLRAGAHQRGVYCWTSASAPPHKKRNTLGMGDDIKRYKLFTLQPKSAIEIG
jgi:hypothetical protein